MTTRKGDWFQTYTGIQFYAYDPRPEEVCIEDIAHHLALQCRYNGACREFYSVAQHSVLVSQNVSAEYALWGLLHDAAEAYLGDLIRPVKLGMRQYREVEALVMAVVQEHFGLVGLEPPEVKRADEVLLYTERRDLLLVQRQWSKNVEPLLDRIVPLGSVQAELEFLARFERLRP